MKKLIYIFVLFSFICNSQINNLGVWNTKGNTFTLNTSVLGTNRNTSLNFKVTALQRFKIDSLGLFRMAPVTSSLVLGSSQNVVSQWYDNFWGFSSFRGLRSTDLTRNNFYPELKTDSVIQHGIILANASNIYDGPWVGASNNNINFFLNGNTSNPVVAIVGVSPYVFYTGIGMIINPSVGIYTSSVYSTNSSLQIYKYMQPYIIKIDSVGKTWFAIDTLNDNVLIKNACTVGSTVAPVATMHVIGTNSVSTTSDFSGALICSTTFSSGTTNTLTGNTRIGGNSAPINPLSVTGAIACSTTFSAGGTSTLAGNVRIGSTVAPITTLHVAGTTSVSGTSSIGDLRHVGALTTSTTFSSGTTNTLVGKTRIGGTVAPTQTLDVTGTMSVSSTSTLNSAVVSTTLLASGTCTIAGNAIKSTALSGAYLPTALRNTATLNFGSTAAGASTDLTITVTGALDGDPVIIGYPNASTLANGIFTAWVSATNTVKVRFTNPNLVTALDPASGTFVAIVRKN